MDLAYEGGEIHLECFLGLGAIHSTQLDKGPKSRIVEIVDVA
jgi:hypothetical protein